MSRLNRRWRRRSSLCRRVSLLATVCRSPRLRRAARTRHARGGAPGARTREAQRSIAGRNPADVRRLRADAGAGSAEDQRRAVPAVPDALQGAAGRPPANTPGAARGSCRSCASCSTTAGADEAQLKEQLKALQDLEARAQTDVDQGLRRDRPGARRPPAGEVSRVRGEHGAPQARAGHARPPGQSRRRPPVAGCRR